MGKELIHYLITDPAYYGHNETSMENTLHQVLKKHRVDVACFRDKTAQNYEALAQTFIKVCQEYNVPKILLNEEYELAIKLKAYGVHLTSEQLHLIPKCKANRLYVIASCHTSKEIAQAQEFKADAITYSPIFATPNKGLPKGVEDLEKAVSSFTIPVIALGGIITEDHIAQIKKTGAHGFASIRYFLK